MINSFAFKINNESATSYLDDPLLKSAIANIDKALDAVMSMPYIESALTKASEVSESVKTALAEVEKCTGLPSGQRIEYANYRWSLVEGPLVSEAKKGVSSSGVAQVVADTSPPIYQVRPIKEKEKESLKHSKHKQDKGNKLKTDKKVPLCKPLRQREESGGDVDLGKAMRYNVGISSILKVEARKVMEIIGLLKTYKRLNFRIAHKKKNSLKVIVRKEDELKPFKIYPIDRKALASSFKGSAEKAEVLSSCRSTANSVSAVLYTQP